ncbi:MULTISPECIES: hypothetical protein [unclassified Lysinibacillus]|uniref:hypothetical protein n=1 Tax=unclassified Lysinibacillus TaxID=2636778 RepID=UPI0037FABA75
MTERRVEVTESNPSYGRKSRSDGKKSKRRKVEPERRKEGSKRRKEEPERRKEGSKRRKVEPEQRKEESK